MTGSVSVCSASDLRLLTVIPVGVDAYVDFFTSGAGQHIQNVVMDLHRYLSFDTAYSSLTKDQAIDTVCSQINGFKENRESESFAGDLLKVDYLIREQASSHRWRMESCYLYAIGH